MLWVGAVPSNALFKLPVVLTVCSVNRQSKLVEPRCSVPVTALRTNLAVHDLEKAAPAQCETAAGRGVAGEFANHFCFAYSPRRMRPGKSVGVRFQADPKRWIIRVIR